MAETGTENIDKLSEEARKAKDNLASFAAQLGLGKPSISGAVKSFGKLGASASTAAKFLENQVGQYQTLTKSGIHFGGSLEKMMQASTAAGLSIKEMTGLTAANSEMLAGFGGTVDAGANMFLANMKKMRTSGNQYGMELRNIGLTHEEIGEAMMLTARMDMMSGKKAGANQASLQERTAKYAKDLDLLSKLTGKSADALKKEQAALQRQGDYRAKMMGKDPEIAAELLAASSEAAANGFDDLFKDMMIKGRASQETALKAGMSPKSMALMKKMYDAMESGSLEGIKSARANLTAAMIQDKMNNRQLAIQGNTTKATGVAASMYADSTEASMKIQSEVAYKRSKGELKSTKEMNDFIAQRTKELKAKAKKEQDDQLTIGKGKGGKTDVLAAVLRGQEDLITAAAGVQKDVTTRIYREAFGPMLKELGSYISSNVPVTKGARLATDAALGALGPKTIPGSATTDQIKSIIDTLNIKVNSGDGAASESLLAIRDLLNDDNTIKDPSLKGQTELTNALNRATSQANQLAMPRIKSNTKVNPDDNFNNYNNGTPGISNAMKGLTSFASATLDFGKKTAVNLHGNELVMTQAQAKQLDEGIAKIRSVLPSSNDSKTSSALPTEQSSSGASNGSASRQGNISNINNASQDDRNNASQGGANMAETQEEMKKMFSKMLEIQDKGPSSEIFEDMASNMKMAASGIGSQLLEQKNLAKVTKNLGSLGNAFSRGVFTR
jgi:hypothetical protein|tara:strand:- start:2850 stop:5033 length:2184 start_codon:yes stop_codon:yes gene_type:complete